MSEKHIQNCELPKTLQCLIEACDERFESEKRWKYFLTHTGTHLTEAQEEDKAVFFSPKTPFIEWALENRIVKLENNSYELELPN
jgi:hypothetical protein